LWRKYTIKTDLEGLENAQVHWRFHYALQCAIISHDDGTS